MEESIKGIIDKIADDLKGIAKQHGGRTVWVPSHARNCQ